MKRDRKELLRAVKFLFFSISAGLIQIAVFTFLNEVVKLPYWPAYLIALIASVVYNFTINRKFTFHSAANIPVAMAKVFAYYCVFTPLSTIGGDYLVELLSNLRPQEDRKLLLFIKDNAEYIVLAISMILNFVTEFLFCRFVVYRNQVDNDGTVQADQSLPPEEKGASGDARKPDAE